MAAPGGATDPAGSVRDVTGAAVRGSTWLLSSTAVTAVLQLASAGVLGRLLQPRDFGVVAAAMLLLRFVYYFSQFGVGSAVVQKPVLSDDDIRAGAWLAVLVGAVGTLVAVASAPLLAALVSRPDSVDVARALSVTFLLTGIGTTPLALLRRQLRFRAVAGVEVVSYGVGYLVVGMLAAAAGAGLWSLVAAALTQSATQTAGALLLAPHPVGLLPRRDSLAPLAGFGGQVSFVGLLEFLSLQTDSFGVARGRGAADLGQYSRGAVLAYPVVQVALVVSRVLSSVFARTTDLARLRRAYSDALVLLATGSAVTAAILAGGHTVLVRGLLGDQWGPAAGLLPWFAAASALQALSQLPATLCEARGALRPKVWIQLAVLGVLVLGIGSAVLADAPLWSYAAGWLVGEVIRQALYLVVAARLFGIGATATARDLLHALVPGLVTLVGVASVDDALAASTAPLPVRLGVLAVVGTACPVATLACWPNARLRAVIRDRGLLRFIPARGPVRRLLARAFG